MKKTSIENTPLETIYVKLTKKNMGKRLNRPSDTDGIYTEEDALQDAILRCLEGNEAGKDIDIAYLPAMAAQCRKNSYKKESKRGHEEVSDYYEIIGGYDNNHELRKHIMSYLSDKDKQLFKQYYIDGLTQTEIFLADKDSYTDQTAVSRSLSKLNNRISDMKLIELVDNRFVMGTPGAEPISDKHWIIYYDQQPGEPTTWDTDDARMPIPTCVPSLYCRWIPGQRYEGTRWEWTLS